MHLRPRNARKRPQISRPLRVLGKLNIASACLLGSAGQSTHGANERCDLAPAGNRLGGVAAMPEGVPVTLGGARICSAVHAAPAIRHRCLLARLPGRPAMGTTSRTEVHSQFARRRQAERAFRTLKTVDIEVRSIHHRRADRVRARVFLRMLAFYVEWRMR
jgi:hypothetical protein